jgi:hypothetical protein
MNVTLCVVSWICHVTVVPTVIVRLWGLNVRFGVVAVAPPACGDITVTVAVAACVAPLAVSDAMIVVVPGATPVTRPDALTDAIPGALDVNVGAGSPDIGVPYWSRGVATSRPVSATAREGVDGVTDSEE